MSWIWCCAGKSCAKRANRSRRKSCAAIVRELLPILVERLRSLESMDSLLHGDQGSGSSGGLNTTPHGRTISIQVPRNPEEPLLPGYEILGELGRGGMGVVYRARQVKASRVVAVKMILGGPHAGSNDMTRFRAEIEILARLQHPNLVQIYEVGECDYRPYYSMELVEGMALDEKIDGQPQPPREAAEMVEILARTVEVVHRQGIIHRDLKPANILLTPDGIPKVTDFGLAKRLGNGSGPTVSGQVLGTPSYMAPEQASGLTREIGPTVDVYALGVILYEMLLGKPPFLGETPWETMRQVVSNEPMPPRRVQPKVPRDLETICLKCLSKDPWRRYPRAGDLADDLRRFLDGWPPIQARPTGPLERSWKWVRRHTALAALLAISILTVIGFPAGYLVYSARLSWTLHQYEKDRAETNRHQIVRLEVHEGAHALDEGDWYTALLWFTEALALDEGDPAQEQMHRIRIGTLLRQLPSLQQYWFHNGPVTHVEFSRDGRRILTASEDKTAQVWDVRTGTAIGPALVHQDAVLGASFSPDGDRVVTACKDGLAQVWSVGTGKPSAPPLHHGGMVYGVSFSADGRRVLTACEDGAARIWDSTSGQLLTPLLYHRGPVRVALFSADGQRVVTAADDGTARVWEGQTGRPISPPLLHDHGLTCVAFSPNGRQVVTGDDDQEAHVWDADTGEHLAGPLRHRGPLTAVSFSPAGRHILTASDDHTACLWHSATGERLSQALVHRSGVTSAAFDQDGRWVVTGGDDNTARVWIATSGEPLTPLLPHCGTVQSAVFCPGSRLVATTTDAGTARLWAFNAQPAALAVVPNDTQDKAQEPLRWWSPDRRWLVTAESNHTAQVRQGDTGQPMGPPLKHGSLVLYAAFNGDGTRLVTASDDNTARIWDPRTGSLLAQTVRHAGAVHRSVFSPESRMLATVSLDGTTRVWDAQTGDTLTPPLKFAGGARRVFFDADGTRVNVVSSNGALWSWDLRPDQDSIDELRFKAQLLSGSRIDAHRRLQPLEITSLREAWETVKKP